MTTTTTAKKKIDATFQTWAATMTTMKGAVECVQRHRLAAQSVRLAARRWACDAIRDAQAPGDARCRVRASRQATTTGAANRPVPRPAAVPTDQWAAVLWSVHC